MGPTPSASPIQLLFLIGMGLLKRDNVKAGQEPGHAISLASGLRGVGEIKPSHSAMGIPRAGLNGAIVEKNKRSREEGKYVKNKCVAVNVARDIEEGGVRKQVLKWEK